MVYIEYLGLVLSERLGGKKGAGNRARFHTRKAT